MEIDTQRSGANALGGNTATGPTTDFDRDAFMQLLVTQIRNQDPMDPMDTRDMMAQLAQLTSVEHLIGIEDRLGTLQVASASIANAQAADFVGKTVEADTSQLRLEDAGTSPGAFNLGARAENVTVTIRDSEGRVVRTMELGSLGAGPQRFQWNGENDNGARVSAGTYRIEVQAMDDEGNPVDAQTRLRGTVTGISYEGGYPSLLLDGEHRVLMGDVREVSAPNTGSQTTSTITSGPSTARAIATYTNTP